MDEKIYDDLIKRYHKLCVSRNHTNAWSENIIDATRDIPVENQIVWQNFYGYLGDTSHIYDPVLQKTLGEGIDDGTIKPIPPYGDDVKIKQVKNGCVYHIEITPKKEVSYIKENESLARIPESVEEEKSISEFT